MANPSGNIWQGGYAVSTEEQAKVTMPSPHDLTCPLCKNDRWVCEAHPAFPMGHGACRAEGMPCMVCNPLAKDPNQSPGLGLSKSLPDGFNVDIDRDVEQ